MINSSGVVHRSYSTMRVKMRFTRSCYKDSNNVMRPYLAKPRAKFLASFATAVEAAVAVAKYSRLLQNGPPPPSLDSAPCAALDHLKGSGLACAPWSVTVAARTLIMV